MNGLNQYLSAGSATFDYGANGNLTKDGSSTYVYDVENQLVSASGATSAGLLYDPLGWLYETNGASGIPRFLYDGDELVAEYNTSGTMLRRNAHGSSVDDPVVGGAIVINCYDDWGIPESTNIGRFQYTGQAWIAELGMYYYKARIYSPTLGRFMQTDPIGYDDQVNLYAYVANDPVNRSDPTGLESAQLSLQGLAGIEADEREHPGDPAARKAVVLTTGAAVSCVFGCRLVPAAFRAIKDALTGKTASAEARAALNAERAQAEAGRLPTQPRCHGQSRAACQCTHASGTAANYRRKRTSSSTANHQERERIGKGPGAAEGPGVKIWILI